MYAHSLARLVCLLAIALCLLPHCSSPPSLPVLKITAANHPCLPPIPPPPAPPLHPLRYLPRLYTIPRKPTKCQLALASSSRSWTRDSLSLATGMQFSGKKTCSPTQNSRPTSALGSCRGVAPCLLTAIRQSTLSLAPCQEERSLARLCISSAGACTAHPVGYIFPVLDCTANAEADAGRPTPIYVRRPPFLFPPMLLSALAWAARRLRCSPAC